MTEREQLTALLERVRNATGADRELDGMIARAVQWSPVDRPWPKGGPPNYWFSDAFGMPFYTASIDAALALTERVLPGWKRQLLEKRGGNAWIARVSSPRWDTYSSGEDGPFPPTAPLALLSALLTTLLEPTP